MNKIFAFLCFFILIGMKTYAQSPSPALVGYWQNWSDPAAPYFPLGEVDSRYNMVDVAFAVPETGTDYQMKFVPDRGTQAEFIQQIQTLQALGTKVNISIGGANAHPSLDNDSERDAFISSMGAIINTYGFDGLDIDLEGSSLAVHGGTINNPVDVPVINLIYAIKQIMANYHVLHAKKLILTMAPETAFVQGGLAAYTGLWGAYLPVIQALRDSLDILHVQLYNSGGTFGLNFVEYYQSTADFIVALTEASIKGFNTAGGTYLGLPASKVAVGLPACPLAAGGGFTDTATVRGAMNYLMGKGPKPGTYTLVTAGGYPDLKGMMTWSVNWDAVSTCASFYQYADNYQRIFAPPILIKTPNGGENLKKGTKYSITWDDAISENVRIELFNGGALAEVIASSAPSNGIMDWDIPNNLLNGSDYKIRVSSVTSDSITDLSNQDFSITDNSGIGDPSAYNQALVYPNPAVDLVTVAISQNTSLIKVSMFNQFSQIVLQANNLRSGKLDVSNLLPGIYIVCISTDSGKYYAKLIKQ